MLMSYVSDGSKAKTLGGIARERAVKSRDKWSLKLFFCEKY